MAAKAVKIDGKMHDPEILEIGEKAGGTITLAVAEKLWLAAADGAKVTDAEKRSVEHVMASYTVQADAKTFLDNRLAARESGCPSQLAPLETIVGTSQYKIIMGVRYERDLFNRTVSATQGGKSMDLKTAENLWQAAMDGGRVTEVEFRTIEFIISFYFLDQDAHDYLEGKLAGHESIKTRKFVGKFWIKPAGDVSDVFPLGSKKREAADAPDPTLGKEPKRQKTKKQELTESERQELTKLLVDMEELIEKPLLTLADQAEPEQKAEVEERESRRKEAEQEVERILETFADTNDITKVLGDGSAADKAVEFRRLTKLLHPDRMLVTGDDADSALRMVLVCMKKLRASS